MSRYGYAGQGGYQGASTASYWNNDPYPNCYMMGIIECIVDEKNKPNTVSYYLIVGRDVYSKGRVFEASISLSFQYNVRTQYEHNY